MVVSNVGREGHFHLRETFGLSYQTSKKLGTASLTSNTPARASDTRQWPTCAPLCSWCCASGGVPGGDSGTDSAG